MYIYIERDYIYIIYMYTYGVRECVYIYIYIYTHKETEIKIYFKELTHMDEAGKSKIHRLVQQAGNSGRISAFQLQGRIPSSLGKLRYLLLRSSTA